MPAFVIETPRQPSRGMALGLGVRKDKLFTHWRKNCPFIEYAEEKRSPLEWGMTKNYHRLGEQIIPAHKHFFPHDDSGVGFSVRDINSPTTLFLLAAITDKRAKSEGKNSVRQQ
jgi:hypothetical protein